MLIQVETTPNPAALKFLPGEILAEHGGVDFVSADAARAAPLAARLFSVSGVARVYIGHDFVSVTRAADASWSDLRTPVLQALQSHFESGDAHLADDGGPAETVDVAPEDVETVSRIREVLDTRIRPAVAQDGGDITFHAFERGTVYLRMQGACAGCPSSDMTLNMGIETLLRHYIPEVDSVRAVG